MTAGYPLRVETGRSQVAHQLAALGVTPGGVLLVHASFRAVRPGEGGPRGLVLALRDALGPGGTLVMPSWGESDAEPFDPGKTPVARDLGVVAEAFRREPGTLRSAHPNAFAAAGPLAPRIVADPLALPPHTAASPAGRVRDLVVAVALEHLGRDPLVFLHPPAEGCEECDEARRSVGSPPCASPSSSRNPTAS